MLMQTVYLSLGSNIGDRRHYLQEAIRLLAENPQILIKKQSHFYETSPVGGVEQEAFLNMALTLSTSLDPLELLDFIHKIEQKLNRIRKIHWGPRTIDIDILFYDTLELKEEKLTLPHSEVFNRLFVLIPLLELVDKNFIYWNKIRESIDKLSESGQEIKIIQ